MFAASLVGIAVTLTAFASIVWIAAPSRPVNQRFALFAVVVACWGIGVAGAHYGEFSHLWVAITFSAGSLLPATFLCFIDSYAPGRLRVPAAVMACAFVGGFICAVLAAGTKLIAFDVSITAAGLVRKQGPLYPFFVVYVLLTWGTGFTLLISKWREAKGRARSQLKYLGAGIIIPAIAIIGTNLLYPLATGHSRYSWLGPYFALVFTAVLGHAIIRHRLMDLRLFVHRGVTIALAISLSAVPGAILLYAVWPHLLSNLESTSLALVLTAIAIVTVLIPITRDVANRLLDRYVYRTHANYQRTVRDASRMLTRVLHLDKLLAFISTTVVRSTAAEGVALYLREDGAFRCAVAEKPKDVEHFAAPAKAPLEVIAALEAAREPIVTDEVARERQAAAVALHERLSEANWALLLPVLSEDTLIAMIAVGPKLSGDAFYQQDLDLLMTLANQAGIAIKNAQLYAAVVVANEYLENIVATLESGVVAINAAGQIAMFNRAAGHLTGLPADTTRGGAVGVLPDCLAEPLLATVADGQPRIQPEVDLPAVTAAGGGPVSRPVICTTSPVRDPGGAVLGAVAVFSDLTPLKELEVERRRAERLAYFQALAAAIAHEIKNPLVAIKTFTQLLPRRRDDARFLEEFGRISTREIERMQRLVDRLQTLSRPAGGPRSPVDVRVPLTDALDFVQPALDEKSLVTTLSLGAQPCMVLGNRAELEQLFLNLLMNAREATPDGGAVAIELTRTEGHATLTVSDTGPGIPPELLERVLEPFFTTKPRGSGLGLAISAGIAQAHGARLRAGNRPGGGAMFTIDFPLVAMVSSVVA
jgi:nitrogen-specific signal transduction histidine kinase